jgi:hypothetical protein
VPGDGQAAAFLTDGRLEDPGGDRCSALRHELEKRVIHGLNVNGRPAGAGRPTHRADRRERFKGLVSPIQVMLVATRRLRDW